MATAPVEATPAAKVAAVKAQVKADAVQTTTVAKEHAKATTTAVANKAAEVKDAFTVELTSGGEQKIAVMKIVKEVLALGLKEAKDLVDGAPKTVKENVKKEERNRQRFRWTGSAR